MKIFCLWTYWGPINTSSHFFNICISVCVCMYMHAHTYIEREYVSQTLACVQIIFVEMTKLQWSAVQQGASL